MTPMELMAAGCSGEPMKRCVSICHEPVTSTPGGKFRSHIAQVARSAVLSRPLTVTGPLPHQPIPQLPLMSAPARSMGRPVTALCVKSKALGTTTGVLAASDEKVGMVDHCDASANFPSEKSS